MRRRQVGTSAGAGAAAEPNALHLAVSGKAEPDVFQGRRLGPPEPDVFHRAWLGPAEPDVFHRAEPVERKRVIRLISARRATKNEREDYEEASRP